MNRAGDPRIALPICSVQPPAAAPAPAPAAATGPDLGLGAFFGSEGGAKKPRRRFHKSRKHLKKRSSRYKHKHKYTKKRTI